MRPLRHVCRELGFARTFFKFICRAMNAIAMAFESNMLAVVQSSLSRIAIRESRTRICDGILAVNYFLRIIGDAVVMQLLFSRLSLSTLGI